MARIRTVKPEFWQDEDLAECSEAARLLAIGLLNHADDEGYFKANPKLIRSVVFPLTEPSVSIQDCLKQLENIKYLELFEGSDGKLYGVIINFSKHQKVNRPTPSKFKGLRVLTENSVSDHEQLTPGKEQGKEQGREHELLADSPEPPPSNENLPDDPGQARKPKPSARRRKLPEDFSLTPDRAEAAEKYWLENQRPDLVAVKIFDEFRNHHTAKGSTMACWDAAWKTWYAKAVQFSKPPELRAGGRTTRDRTLREDLTRTDW